MLRATLAAALLACGVFAGWVLAGCEIVTGGTSGYTSPDAGAGVSGSCTSSSDCSGAQLCCIAVAEGGAPTTQCQASCPAWEQPCVIASDCGDGGICWVQACPVDVSGFSEAVTVSTCGPIPACAQ